jgi:RsiW-degrading membrane proteinase PrsW (M82 family)
VKSVSSTRAAFAERLRSFAAFALRGHALPKLWRRALGRLPIVRLVVVVIISVVVMVIVVIGGRVPDRRAADAAHHRADRTADDSAADGACNPARDRAALVCKSRTA